MEKPDLRRGDLVPQTLELHFLGGFRILSGGESLPGIVSPRLQSLLAYLLLHRDTPQSRRYLAFLLWPDSSESQARTNLRNLLHTLRQSITDADCFVLADTQTVQWNPESPFTVDFIAFEEAVRRANDSTALIRAVDLYPGDLLPDCYEDWIQPERDRLQNLYMDGLERLILALEQEHHLHAAIRYAERLLHLDPLREATYRQLMGLYAKSGDRLGVVRVYQTCINVLKRKLNVEVSASTQATYEELTQTEISSDRVDESLPKVRSNNLPIPLTSFIGREQIITDIKQILSGHASVHPYTRLLTLTGAGGCGKTRLVIQIASQLIDTFRDGVWLVELAPLSNPRLVLQAVASVFGLREQKGKSITETLIRYLETKSLLLILDNCEHLLDACAHLVEELLQTCPQLKVIITSREQLNLPGEIIWRVPPLSLPDAKAPLSVESLMKFEAVQLFVDRAATVLPTFEITRQNAASIVGVCQHLDGIPLAIELAAARVRSLPVEQILLRLSDRFHLLKNGSRTALPRHQTMWDLIDWSYELLPAAEQALLRRLVVFSDGWTLAAAEQICADQEPVTEPGKGVQKREILDLLTHLVDQSLITYQPAVSQTRYNMFESIRAYGWERLRQAGEDQEICHKHANYYLQLTEDLDPQLRGPRQMLAIKELEQELDNLRTVFEWVQKHTDIAPLARCRLVSSLSWFWVMKGYIIEGRRWMEAVLQNLTGQEAPAILARVYSGAGLIAMFQNDYQAVYDWFQTSVSLWQFLGDELHLARVRGTLAYIFYMEGEQAKAIDLWEADKAVLQGLNDEWGLGWILSFYARAMRDTYQNDLARSLYIESARLFEAAGDEWTLAIIRSHLGQIEYQLGHYAAARELYEKRLAIGQEMGSITHLKIAHFWLAKIDSMEGNVEAAALHYKEDLRLDLVYGGDEDTFESLAGFAWTTGMKGQWREAVELFTVAEQAMEKHYLAIAKNTVKDDGQEQHRFFIHSELSRALAYLGESAFAEAREAGRSLTLEQAIASLL